MDKNEQFIRNVKIENIPWNRLNTAYTWATDFPEYLNVIQAMSNWSEVKSALSTVFSNIEHQSTLWRATPFSMIFLVRSFEKAVAEMNHNKIAFFIVEELLQFFILIAELFEEEKAFDSPSSTPLPFFEDMLKEEYLFPEKPEKEEEEDILWEEDMENFSDELFYSFYYYSYEALLYCKEALNNIKDTHLCKDVAELKKHL